MMLTTKGRYAVVAVLEIALLPANQPVKLAQVARHQHIPINYLEQIFVKLKKAGLVKALKGPGGGYLLNAQPQTIRIANIIDAVNENIEMSSCKLKNKGQCLPNNSKCRTHYLWQGLTNTIRSYFETITLEDLIKKDDKIILGKKYDLS